MKIELKNIRHSPSLSEETEAFTANLYINGKHVGYAKNQGHGGPTDYYPNDDEGRKLIREAEDFCKAMPPKEYPASPGMEAFKMDMNLECFIDDFLNGYLQNKEIAKFNQKMDKAMENGIVFGIPDDSYKVLGLKMPVGMLLVHLNGGDRLKEIIAKKILPELKDGVMVLNNNIPEQILRDAGLAEGQYRKQEVQQEQKKTNKKNQGRKL